ncbi:MAG TPA: LLM class flavin-dependent oxidoreductase [Acidimicrobiales bacterium]|nr:LLM class flavin-dependent oxidoreductase [Acidimicrobiales bacterium]
MLPTFRRDAAAALDAARACEAAGIHGVFAYDHLWPMGQPGRPAISPYPLLGAVAASTSTIRIGTLVARVGLVPDDVLVGELLTLAELSGGRLIAAVGTGDHESAPENAAYGVDFAPAAERRARLEQVVARLSGAGVEVWVGGGAPATSAVARRSGATVNLWGALPSAVAVLAAEGATSWGGNLPADVGAASALLVELRDAGATWAVLSWPGSTAPILAAAGAAGLAVAP